MSFRESPESVYNNPKNTYLTENHPYKYLTKIWRDRIRFF